MPMPAEEIYDHVVMGPNNCWVWTKGKTSAGYGVSTLLDGKRDYAHRISVRLSGRETPKGTHTDHLCRNPPCINPDHLEIVTPRENYLRGNSPQSSIAARLAQTHCLRGHEFTTENTYLANSRNGRRRERHCRECSRIRKATYRNKQRSARCNERE